MTETSSPTVWRRWLAFELVRLRKEAGLDQRDVAKALRCTVGKVSYYETAERPVVLRDLDEVLLPLYDVPADRWEDYLRAAKNARQKGWWEKLDGGSMPSWFSLFVGLEQGASQVRAYESEAVPGLLQTRAYADAITRRGTAERAEEEVARRIDLRMTRQSVLRRAADPLRLWVVLSEAVLRRVVGGPATMKEQLLYLTEKADHPKITMQVIPYPQSAEVVRE
ncbi:helix-turn-helix domain-containing protein [Streptomyces sp. NPDC014724]|uniref:helix-turn-helix domain-containing protein n=1 Tax=unclassified Streptomyces TaxID=2593676 RepID=UPI00370362CF